MSIGGAGYYINKAGGGELIGNALSRDEKQIMDPPTSDTVAGLYICDTNSGCTKKYVLILKSDQMAEMTVIDPITEEENELENVEATIDENKVLAPLSPLVNSNSSTSPTDGAAIVESPTVDTSTTTLPFTDTPVASPLTDEVLSEKYLSDVPEQAILTVEKGDWSLGVMNLLVITFTETGSSTYDIPQKIVVKSVGASLLSKISYTKSNYKDMVKPVFIKQE